MRRPISFKLSLALIVGVGVGLGAGCGEAPTHPLTLVPFQVPESDCQPDCPQFYGCSELGIQELSIEVGVFHRESTTLPCPPELKSGPSPASVQVQVPYQPGQDFYMIDASFGREGSTVYLSAGPFTEDDAQTPWRLKLR